MYFHNIFECATDLQEILCNYITTNVGTLAIHHMHFHSKCKLQRLPVAGITEILQIQSGCIPNRPQPSRLPFSSFRRKSHFSPFQGAFRTYTSFCMNFHHEYRFKGVILSKACRALNVLASCGFDTEPPVDRFRYPNVLCESGTLVATTCWLCGNEQECLTKNV